MTETIQHSALEHVQLAPGRFLGRLFHSRTREIQIDYGNYNVPILAKGPMSPEGVTLGFLMRSPGETTFYSEPAPEGTMALWGEATEMHTKLAPNSQWFTLQVGRNTLASAGIDLPERVRAQYPLDSTSFARLGQVVGAALLELDKIKTLPAVRSHFEAIMDELADTMVSSVGHVLQARHSRRVGCAGTRMRREAVILERAEAYMAANLAEPVTVRGICSEIDCPIYTLERVFRKSLGVSPKQFLTFRRLAELRRVLVGRSAQDISIASAAVSCGLTHLGRAAAAYQRVYGELPSETLNTPGPRVIAGAGS